MLVSWRCVLYNVNKREKRIQTNNSVATIDLHISTKKDLSPDKFPETKNEKLMETQNVIS